MKKFLLSIFTIAAIQTSFAQTKEYTNGVFILNEDWFGHTNGSINFMNPDYSIDYNIYKTANTNEELGVTPPFATIYGDNFFIVSKQGNRLVVADSKTLQKKASFETIGGDGRSFVGVDAKTGYLGTSSGLYLFDIENLKLGSLIEGADKFGALANIIRTSTYVFAVTQKGGILVIDPNTHKIKQTITGSFISVVQSKDGNVWGALANKLVKIDPVTLETKEIAIPTKTIPNTWGAWNAGSFSASTQENSIYFFPGAGWSVSPTIVKYDVDKNEFNENFATIPGQDTNPKQMPYGAGLRVDPRTDELIIITTTSQYNKHWIHKFDNKGNLTKTIPLTDYYWFQSLPVFPDNAAPIINDLETTYQINTVTTIDLKDKVSDQDNLTAAIVKDLEIIENDDVAEISINEKDELVINPLKNGTAKIKLSFNSNGKVVSQNITISSAVLGTSDLNKSSINAYPNPVNNVLFIETNEASKAEIFAITGTKMTEKTLQKGKNQLDVSSLPKGVYIIKVNNSTFKVIKK
ncbi:DUF5074 domain-containing protein [Empedobacter falsenii]|uniref:DUF5074 domain-containing protein n=1 Tax=Empedobacter falsenii TaxID=343874 RepID=UPI0025791C20|nr:DUF5074 domain-containing protein [Empedobacter falsenii]MDM1548991.1 DUF5074 domain-containing protein [Empedobacter falsenii]